MVSDLLVQIWDLLQAIYYFLYPIFFVVNIFFAITIVFVERKNPNRAVSWILALLLLPVPWIFFIPGLWSELPQRKTVFTQE